jgi:hypothetical protein
MFRLWTNWLKINKSRLRASKAKKRRKSWKRWNIWNVRRWLRRDSKMFSMRQSWRVAVTGGVEAKWEPLGGIKTLEPCPEWKETSPNGSNTCVVGITTGRKSPTCGVRSIYSQKLGENGIPTYWTSVIENLIGQTPAITTFAAAKDLQRHETKNKSVKSQQFLLTFVVQSTQNSFSSMYFNEYDNKEQ